MFMYCLDLYIMLDNKKIYIFKSKVWLFLTSYLLTKMTRVEFRFIFIYIVHYDNVQLSQVSQENFIKKIKIKILFSQVWQNK